MIGSLAPVTPILVFDGDCGFCSTCARFARRWVDRRGRYSITPYQHLDLESLGLTSRQCSEATWFVTPSGAQLAGALAVSAALRSGAPGWRPLGLLLAAPGVRVLAGLIYRWVAANRFRLPGGTPQCAAPPRPPQSGQ